MKRHIVVGVLAFGVATYAVLLNHYLSRGRAVSRPSDAATSWQAIQPVQPLAPVQYVAAPPMLMRSNPIQRFQLQIVPSSQGGSETMLKLDTLTGEVWKYSEDTGQWLPMGNDPRREAAPELPIQHFEVDALVEEEGEGLDPGNLFRWN